MKRYGRKTAQGAWQPPDLCAMVTAWFRQRRNTHPRSAAGRIKRHSRLVADVTDRSRVQRLCQQSSSEQASHRSLPHSCESSLAALLLLSKSNPLRWASIWFAPCGRRLGCAENRVGLPPNRRGGRNKRNFSCTAKKPVISRITGFSSCSEISLRTSGSTQRFYP